MSEKITMYRFKVSLIGPHEQPIGKLHRIIDVAGNAPFVVLHELIFEAFDRFDPHLFKFTAHPQRSQKRAGFVWLHRRSGRFGICAGFRR